MTTPKDIDLSSISDDDIIYEMDRRNLHEWDIGVFTSDELIDELVDRESIDSLLTEIYNSGFGLPPAYAAIRAIYELRRLGKDYQTELDNLIYNTIGNVL